MRKTVALFFTVLLIISSLTACGSPGQSSSGKDIDVVFSKVGFGSTIEDVKSVYGECPTENVHLGTDDKFEYEYPCDYVEGSLVFFGFDADEKLATIRFNFHGAPEDADPAYDKLYKDITDKYGKPAQEQEGAMAMWNDPHIMISKMAVMSNVIVDCSFFSPEYTESIKNN